MVTFADLSVIFPTESANNQKLMLEYEKFQEMQSKMMKMQEEYERQLIEKEESKQRDMERQTEYYETKLQEMTAKLEQVDLATPSVYHYKVYSGHWYMYIAVNPILFGIFSWSRYLDVFN